ncbi:MAG: hypothetical protein Q8L48_16660 [Archangium sp.]|nr:hypothetical protein [Archangium sp.]
MKTEKPCICDPNPFQCGPGCLCAGCGCIKERPILFSAPMVLALLAGTKTQTRRIVKPQPKSARATTKESPVEPIELPILGDPEKEPFRAGMRLWVKETWRPLSSIRMRGRIHCIEYAADKKAEFCTAAKDWKKPKAAKTGNVSPLFMPRWASRLTLEVTGVRIERLQEITPTDAIAEGIQHLYEWAQYPRRVYSQLWESINGAGSWAANPWVWAITFKVLTEP